MKTILIKSSWQDVNTGDIGHTPGLLAILEKHLPDRRLILWPEDDNPDVDIMIRKRFPNVEIVRGTTLDGTPDDNPLYRAFHEADFLLHSSGPFIVGHRGIELWVSSTGKPYGFYGISLSEVDAVSRPLLEGAKFVFARDPATLDLLKQANLQGVTVDFAPDACSAVDVSNEPKAIQWMERAGLRNHEFLVAIPRNRKTPYYWSKQADHWSQDRIRATEDFNYLHREADLSKLREVICAWVRGTGMQVLLAPEMVDALALLGPSVYAPLPEDVRPFIIIRDKWWLTDEAASVFSRARAMVSLDCHSPLIAMASGVPFIYWYQPQDAAKAQMYPAFGLGDWLVPIEEDASTEVVKARLLAFHTDRAGTTKYLSMATAQIQELHRSHLLRELLPV